MRYSEERQTRQAGFIVYSERTTFFSIKIILYSVYVPLSAITLFKNNAATRHVELCFVHAWYTTSLGKQPLQAFKLARGMPFFKEMSSTVYPRGVVGHEALVHARCTYSLLVYVHHLRGVV